MKTSTIALSELYFNLAEIALEWEAQGKPKEYFAKVLEGDAAMGEILQEISDSYEQKKKVASTVKTPSEKTTKEKIDEGKQAWEKTVKKHGLTLEELEAKYAGNEEPKVHAWYLFNEQEWKPIPETDPNFRAIVGLTAGENQPNTLNYPPTKLTIKVGTDKKTADTYIVRANGKKKTDTLDVVLCSGLPEKKKKESAGNLAKTNEKPSAENSRVSAGETTYRKEGTSYIPDDKQGDYVLRPRINKDGSIGKRKKYLLWREKEALQAYDKALADAKKGKEDADKKELEKLKKQDEVFLKAASTVKPKGEDKPKKGKSSAFMKSTVDVLDNITSKGEIEDFAELLHKEKVATAKALYLALQARFEGK